MNICFNDPVIKFYFSFQCPYSYMTWELLRGLLKDQKTTIAPIEIGLTSPGTTKSDFRELWSEERWQRLTKDAAGCGLRINPPDTYVSSVTAAAAIAAYGPGGAEDYITSVFRAVFFRHIDISATSALRLHLQSEGLDSSILADAADNPDAVAAAKNNILLWGHERIRLVPTLDIDSDRYCGFIDKYGLERYLRSVME